MSSSWSNEVTQSILPLVCPTFVKKKKLWRLRNIYELTNVPWPLPHYRRSGKSCGTCALSAKKDLMLQKDFYQFLLNSSSSKLLSQKNVCFWWKKILLYHNIRIVNVNYSFCIPCLWQTNGPTDFYHWAQVPRRIRFFFQVCINPTPRPMTYDS
jgi:hypothetical protein